MLWDQRKSVPSQILLGILGCASALMVCLLSLHSAPPSQVLYTAHSLWTALLSNRDMPIISEAELSGENQVLGCLITLVRVLTTQVRRIPPSTQHREPPNPLVILCWGLYSGFLWPCSNPVFSETPGPNCCFQDHQRKKKPFSVDFIMGNHLAMVHFNLAPGAYLCITEGPIKVFSKQKIRFFAKKNSSPTLGMWKYCS